MQNDLDWRKHIDDEDPDDESGPTPQDVIDVLGFDPADEQSERTRKADHTMPGFDQLDELFNNAASPEASEAVRSVAESLASDLKPIRARLEEIAAMEDTDLQYQALSDLRDGLPKHLDIDGKTESTLNALLNAEFFHGAHLASKAKVSPDIDWGLWGAGIGAALALGLFLAHYSRFELEQTRKDLERRAEVVAAVMRAELADRAARQIDGLLAAPKRDVSEVVQALADTYKADSKTGLAKSGAVAIGTETNLQAAKGFGRWKCRRTLSYCERYPCDEFFRAEDRIEKRNWPQRWADLGAEFYHGFRSSDYAEGRMVAPANSQLWIDLSRWGTAWAPFDWNSGMDREPIERNEAIEIGAWHPTDKVTQPGDRRFNDSLSLNPNLSKDLLAQLGEQMSGEFLDV